MIDRYHVTVTASDGAAIEVEAVIEFLPWTRPDVYEIEPPPGQGAGSLALMAHVAGDRWIRRIAPRVMWSRDSR